MQLTAPHPANSRWARHLIRTDRHAARLMRLQLRRW